MRYPVAKALRDLMQKQQLCPLLKEGAERRQTKQNKAALLTVICQGGMQDEV